MQMKATAAAVVYHAGLAQPVLHHQDVLQAKRGAVLQLLQGDLQRGRRHLGQRLRGDTAESRFISGQRQKRRRRKTYG